MKILGIVLIGLLLSNGVWLTDFAKASQEAKQSNKMILLNFSGSDWCAPCIMMKRNVFEKPEFIEFADQKLILVRADFPRHKKHQLSADQKAHNEKLAEKYNSKGRFPLTLLLDADGHVIREWDGYSGGNVEEFIKQVTTPGDEK